MLETRINYLERVMFKSVLFSSLLLFLLSIPGVSADSLKGDGKTYNGLGCTEIAGGVLYPDSGSPYGDNDVRYTAAGWAFNGSTRHGITVACPIVREHTSKPMKRAWVTVYNQTQAKVVCQIEAFDKDGLFLEESSDFVFPSSTYPVTGFKSNDKDDDDSGPFDNSFEYVPQLKNEHGYYMLICHLPSAEYWTIEDGNHSESSYRFAYVVKYLIDEVSN